MRNLSLRLRLALAHTVIFSILLILLAVAVYHFAVGRLFAQVDDQLQERYATLRTSFRIDGDKVSWLYDRGDTEQNFLIVRAGRYYQVFDHNGQLLDASELAEVLKLPFTALAREALEKQSLRWETFSLPNGQKIRMVDSPMVSSEGRAYLLRVGMLLDQVEQGQRQLALALLVLIPLVLGVAAASGWWLAGRALRPVAVISKSAGQITASRLTERLPMRGTGDELDQLSATLNAMIARLHDSFEQMRQFISNVSHELRTPLAALRGQSEVALRNAGSAESLRAVLASNIEEMDRLSRAVSDLLTLARAEAGHEPLRRNREDLSELVRDAVESTRVLAAERGIHTQFKANGQIFVQVDPAHMLRLLLNLLDNAIKFNRPDGEVNVEVDAVDSWAVISVSDTGEGIPSEELPHIFERFYRGEKSGNGGFQGAGLGLSLAKWIVQAHGGSIEVESQAGQGSTFRVWLPREKAAA